LVKNRKEVPVRRLIETILSLGICIVALATTPVHGQTRNPLVGAWKVTEIANPNSPPITNPQAGLYVFTQKHYSAVRLNGTKPLPNYASNDAATDAEKVASFNTIYVNSGAYAVNGNLLTLSP
jgi:hypothetical protein